MMTRQETFKRRIRLRMEKTGERYGAARRALIEKSQAALNGQATRSWVAQPDTSDESIRSATGHGWDMWCDILDAWPGHTGGHAAIATYLHETHGVDGWWSQAVTVGYERITGLRLPYQQPDGTFRAGKSRTVTVDAEGLKEMLLSEGDRADLFPGFETHLQSKPSSKTPRISIGPGVAQFTLDPQASGKTKVTITHDRLPTFADVEDWKHYWSEWLEAIDQD